MTGNGALLKLARALQHHYGQMMVKPPPGRVSLSENGLYWAGYREGVYVCTQHILRLIENTETKETKGNMTATVTVQFDFNGPKRVFQTTDVGPGDRIQVLVVGKNNTLLNYGDFSPEEEAQKPEGTP